MNIGRPWANILVGAYFRGKSKIKNWIGLYSGVRVKQDGGLFGGIFRYSGDSRNPRKNMIIVLNLILSDSDLF